MRRGGGWQFALAFVAGCLVAPWLPALPGPATLIALAAVAGVGCAFDATRLPAIGLLGGCWFLAAAVWQVDQQWPQERAGEVVSVTGTVVDLPRRRDESVRLLLAVDVAASSSGAPERILVRWYRPRHRPEPGSRWRMRLRLDPPSGRDNPGAFDYQRYLLARRIGAVASVRGDPVLLADEGHRRWLDRRRQHLADVIQSETVNLDVAALERALGVADRSAIRPELAERLRQTGTAHLLAISGLHVGMVAGMAGLVAAWLAAPLALVTSRLDRRRVAVVAGLIAALGYAGLAGFSLPTQRALVMLAVIAVALLARRSLAPSRALLLAMLAVLAFDPLAPLATGFWLSFAAVAVLIWAFAWRSAPEGRWLTGLLRAQLVIMVGLLPLNVGLFGQLVPGALLANLVAIPLVGVVVLPALLVEMSSVLLGLPATPAGWLADTGLAWLVDYLAWVRSLDGAFLTVAGGGWLAVLAAAAGGLWLIAPPGWPARWLGVILILPLMLPVRSELRAGELEAWFLDVGNGLAVLVRTSESVLLYDTGPGDGEGGDALGRLLPGLMARLGIERIDRVVVSHDHRGHAGGVGSLPERARVLSSIEGLGTHCTRGRQWRSGRYRFRFLHPSAALPDLGGNSSCVLEITGPGGSLLLTGRIDADVEARLIDDQDGLSVDVVQLPGGGHRSGASARFLNAVDPTLAIASVERFDRFGRVHPATRQRLEAAGVEWLATGKCGAIRVFFAPGRPPAADSMASRQARFWKRSPGCP